MAHRILDTPADLGEFVRFDAKVDKIGHAGCWLWLGTKDKYGYGRFRIGSRSDGSRRTILAHRFSWAVHNGPIPKGMLVLHRCDDPRCVNPSHLFAGTHKDNMADMWAKNRAALQCGEANARARLTISDVLEIRRLASKISQREISKRFGIGCSQVSAIVNGKSWKERHP